MKNNILSDILRTNIDTTTIIDYIDEIEDTDHPYGSEILDDLREKMEEISYLFVTVSTLEDES